MAIANASQLYIAYNYKYTAAWDHPYNGWVSEWWLWKISSVLKL